MSHHSSDASLTSHFGSTNEERAKLDKMLRQAKDQDKAEQTLLRNTLGPTGDHPHGRIVPHDEGGLLFGVTVFNGRVVFDFGKPVRSIGFTREGALELAELIKQRAEQCPAIFVSKKVG